MKKGLFIIILTFAVIMVILTMKLASLRAFNAETRKFNKEYEYYNKSGLYGLDIATVINKAVNNNEKYEVKKNEKNRYIDDENYSIKIEIIMKLNETTYDMEQIYNLGTEKFIEYYGDVKFNCINIEYHKSTGRISKLIFESQE